MSRSPAPAITVCAYGAEATYSGACDFAWDAPPVGGRHKLMLFLAQGDDFSREAEAAAELAKFGFVDLHLMAGRPLMVESLNDPRMHAFSKHYEGALENGCSIVWYP
ncbi:hypothetical protein ASD34_25165 [Variovorax sp. Root473]|nr:hypothetical protein ASD34_25165 [Variovorax sp. Root473]